MKGSLLEFSTHLFIGFHKINLMMRKTRIPAPQNPTASHPCAQCVESLVLATVAMERGVIIKTSSNTPGIEKVLPTIKF